LSINYQRGAVMAALSHWRPVRQRLPAALPICQMAPRAKIGRWENSRKMAQLAFMESFIAVN